MVWTEISLWRFLLLLFIAEQQWAYYARYIQSMWDAPTGQPYYDLRDIVAEKEVFVLTTNIDMQFERIFQKERICD